MPEAIRTHRPRTLASPSKTLAERRAETGRTLALNGAAWRRLRALVLSRQPLCPQCQAGGYVVPATEVDHVDNDSTNNQPDNLRGLCKAHHSQKTGRERQQKSPATGHHEPCSPTHAHRRTCRV